MTLHYVCLMAYGDALVTLSVLEDLPPEPGRWRVIGTRVTAQVSELLRQPIPVVEILPDKAAFNTIKERGVRAALADFGVARRALRHLTAPGDVLAFERSDLRNRGLLSRGRKGDYAARQDSAYSDRQDQASRLFGPRPAWQSVLPPARTVREVAVNPCARYRNRALSSTLIGNVLRLGGEQGWKLTLIDPCGEYGHLASSVSRYLPRPTLLDAAAALRRADLYVGPDSFFIHLAYYYRIPHFGFYHPANLYFLTPGMREQNNWCSFVEAEQFEFMRSAVLRYIG